MKSRNHLSENCGLWGTNERTSFLLLSNFGKMRHSLLVEHIAESNISGLRGKKFIKNEANFFVSTYFFGMLPLEELPESDSFPAVCQEAVCEDDRGSVLRNIRINV